jgi:hypothetical protein
MKKNSYSLIEFCDQTISIINPLDKDFFFHLFQLIILFKEVSTYFSKPKVSLNDMIHFSIYINKGTDGFEFETKRLMHHKNDIALLK